MALSQHVCKEAVCPELRVRKREQAIRTLLERFVEGGGLAEGMVEPLQEAILERERLGSTAIGNGVAVPHARDENLREVMVGFAQCPEGVEFNALDGEPVYQIFLVVASEDHNDQYLEVMERITRLVQDEDFRRFAAATPDRQGVLELIEEMGG